MPFVPAICTQCGASIEVDSAQSAAVCSHCGTPFIVENAITQYNTTVNADTVVVSGLNAEAMLKRGILYMEDGEWSLAEEYYNKALDANPEFAPAYVAKLCLDMEVPYKEDLVKCNRSFKHNSNFDKAVRFADAKLRAELNGYCEAVEERLRLAHEEQERKAKAERERREVEAEAARAKAAARTKKIRKAAPIAAAVVAAVIVVLVALNALVIIPSNYRKAEGLLAEGNAREAYVLFAKKENYKDSRDYMDKCLTPIRETLPHGSIGAGEYHTIARKSDGTVLAVGGREFKEHVATAEAWTDIKAVFAGHYYAAALGTNGKVYAAGYTSNIDKSDYNYKIERWSDIVSIDFGDFHAVGLKADGTVVVEAGRFSSRSKAESWSDIVAAAAGVAHTVGLGSDGTLIIAVENDRIEAKDGERHVSGWRDIVAIAAADGWTVGLQADGTVVATGENKSGQCNTQDWRDVVAVATGGSHTVGLKADGTVVATGQNKDGQCNVQGWRDIVAIAAGRYHTVGLKADGTVVAVGNDTAGQCRVDKWQDVAVS